MSMEQNPSCQDDSHIGGQNILRIFGKHEGSLPPSPGRFNEPYPESVQSSPHRHNLLL
jgi:hypothetical protein